jgi:hypothetical protein
MGDSPIKRAAPYRSGLIMQVRLGQSRTYGKRQMGRNIGRVKRKGLTDLIAHLTLSGEPGLRRPFAVQFLPIIISK